LLVAFADENDHIGSTQQPFSSFMSVYTELGFLGLACVLIAVMRILRRVQRAARNDEQQRLPALLFTAGVTFLVLLGLQENYWEAPQAIFIGLLLLKVLYANIVHGASTDDPETEPT
jgi:O-antigen ligase